MSIAVARGPKKDLHRRAEAAHAKRRAKERYGIDVNRHQLASMVQAIQQGLAWRFATARDTLRFKGYLLWSHDRVVHVIYDGVLKQIVTFLPPDKPALRIMPEDEIDMVKQLGPLLSFEDAQAICDADYAKFRLLGAI